MNPDGKLSLLTSRFLSVESGRESFEPLTSLRIQLEPAGLESEFQPSFAKMKFLQPLQNLEFPSIIFVVFLIH